jgi:hypothetical protein
MSVPTSSIIEYLDVVKDVGPGEVARFVDVFFDPFFHQATKEVARNSIAQVVTESAHAGFQVIGHQEAQPLIAIVLGILIRMHHDLSK